MLSDLPKLQAGGEVSAEPGHAAPHPRGRHQSGAGLPAWRRARARCKTWEVKINSVTTNYPKMTHFLGVNTLPANTDFSTVQLDS